MICKGCEARREWIKKQTEIASERIKQVLQLIEESNQAVKYELTMQIRGIVVNPALEIGILLILGDLYANRENTTDKTANELPMGAKHHLQPFRIMGI